MSTTLVPSLSSLASVRYGELCGWCRMLRRRHPDMDEVVTAVEEAGRKIINELEAAGDGARLLSIGIVGAAVEAYAAAQSEVTVDEAAVENTEHAADAEPVDSVAL